MIYSKILPNYRGLSLKKRLKNNKFYHINFVEASPPVSNLLDLLAFYTLDDSSGEVSLSDSIGSANLTNVGSVALDTGKVGGGAVWTTDGSFLTRAAFDLTTYPNFTFFGWFYIPDMTSWNETDSSFTFQSQFNGFNLSLEFPTGGSPTFYLGVLDVVSSYIKFPSSINIGTSAQWVFFEWGYSSASGWFIGITPDGAGGVNPYDYSMTAPENRPSSTSLTNILSDEFNSNGAFSLSGFKMDEVGICSRLLTGAERTSIFNTVNAGSSTLTLN